MNMDAWMRRAADPDDPFPNEDIDESSPYHRDRARQPAGGTWGDTDYPLNQEDNAPTSDQQNQRPGRNLPVWGGEVDETGPGKPPRWLRPSLHFDPANPQGVEPGSTWHDEQRQPWEGTTRIGVPESERTPTPGLRDEATLAPNAIVSDLEFPVYRPDPPTYDREGLENQRGPLTAPLPAAGGHSRTEGIEDPNSPRSIYRVPLKQRQGGAAGEDDGVAGPGFPMAPGGYTNPDLTYPVDPRPAPIYDREGLDRTNDFIRGNNPPGRVIVEPVIDPRTVYRVPLGGGQRAQPTLGALNPKVAARWRQQFGRDPSPEEAAEIQSMLGSAP